MSVVDLLRGWLTEPELRAIDPDSALFTRVHRSVLERKRLLRRLFTEFCERCLEADRRYFAGCPSELRLEIGSGAGVMKEVFPEVVTSDVKFLPSVELVLRGEDLPFADGSVRSVYGINVFHHVSDPRDFFREAVRALAPGGGLCSSSPTTGPWPACCSSGSSPRNRTRWRRRSGPGTAASRWLPARTRPCPTWS